MNVSACRRPAYLKRMFLPGGSHRALIAVLLVHTVKIIMPHVLHVSLVPIGLRPGELTAAS